MIFFPSSRVWGFFGNLCTKKLNKTQTNQENKICVQYFCDIWTFACINSSGFKLFLFFIISLFYFLIICANLTFLFVPLIKILMPLP